MLTGRSCGGTWVMSTSSIMMRPELGVSNPASIRSSVVLPQPDAPTSANISPLKICRLTLSTAVKAPKVLLTLSMTICGLASGSSQGRSAIDLGAAVHAALELRRRRRAPALGRKEGTLDHLRARHATLPDEFPIQIDFRPDARADFKCGASTIARAMLRLQVGDQIAEVTLPISRLPLLSAYSSALCAGLLPAMSRPTSWRCGPRCFSVEQRAPAGEMSLVEVHQPASPSSSGERSRADANGVLGRHEVDVRAQEAGLDARNVERLRADRRGCRANVLPPSARPRSPRQPAGIHPQLVAQIAGESGARHHDRGAVQREIADLERLRAFHARQGRTP